MARPMMNPTGFAKGCGVVPPKPRPYGTPNTISHVPDAASPNAGGPPLQKSNPGPPPNPSKPAWPKSTSLPARPKIVSLPASPAMTSLPAVPMTRSLPFVPTTVPLPLRERVAEGRVRATPYSAVASRCSPHTPLSERQISPSVT